MIKIQINVFTGSKIRGESAVCRQHIVYPPWNLTVVYPKCIHRRCSCMSYSVTRWPKL